jgi:hypothetical protein
MKENSEQNWGERARGKEPAAIAEPFRHYWPNHQTNRFLIF